MHVLANIKLGIVCPMANEGEGSTRFVREVLERCGGFREVLFFAVLDSTTTDNSLLLLREMERAEPRLKVVWAPENQCVVDAYVRGYREALLARARPFFRPKSKLIAAIFALWSFRSTTTYKAPNSRVPRSRIPFSSFGDWSNYVASANCSRAGRQPLFCSALNLRIRNAVYREVP